MIFVYIVALFIIAPIGIWITWRKWFANNYVTPAPVIVYHSINKEKRILPTNVDRSSFKSQIGWLKANNYRTLSPDEFLRQEKSPLSVFIGFEDSYYSITENALPILKSAGYTATLFVISDYIGKTNGWDVAISNSNHMSEDDIKEALKNGFCLASHTKTHTDLRSLNDIELRNELEGSRLSLEARFGVPVKALSYPFGRYNDRVKASAKDSGYSMAFTINRPVNQKTFDPFAIPACGIYSLDKLHNFSAKIERSPAYWMDIMRDKMFNRFACGTILVKTGKQKR
jgi:peptidoglycan/xylan/chitin deacetylase (PgdA/CDA1 family)